MVLCHKLGTFILFRRCRESPGCQAKPIMKLEGHQEDDKCEYHLCTVSTVIMYALEMVYLHNHAVCDESHGSLHSILREQVLQVSAPSLRKSGGMLLTIRCLLSGVFLLKVDNM